MDAESDAHLYHAGLLALMAELEQSLRARAQDLPAGVAHQIADRLDDLSIRLRRLGNLP
jgi:hypothetical protein